MKRLLIIATLIFGLNAISAQNYISYLTEISFKASFQHEDLRIEFIEVTSDSRCPKSVTCVRSGEAKIKVAIYRSDKLVEIKELIFEASGLVDHDANLLFSNADYRILGVSLYPYPETADKIPHDAYTLEIKIN